MQRSLIYETRLHKFEMVKGPNGWHQEKATTHQVQGSSASPVHQRNGDDGHGNHDGANANGRVLGFGGLDPGALEEVRGVVEDGSDAGQLKVIRDYYIVSCVEKL